MQDYTPAARAFWFVLAFVGLTVLAWAVVETIAQPFDAQVKILFAATAAGIIGYFPVLIPGARISIAGGDLFVFLAFILYGPPAAMVVAAAEGIVASMRSTKRWTSWVATPASSAISLAVAALVIDVIQPIIARLPSLAGTMSELFTLALCFGWTSVAIHQAIIALKAGKVPHPIAAIRGFHWFTVTQLAYASVAGLLYTSQRQFGLEAIVVAVPLITIFLAPLHFQMKRKEADERHMVELMESERRLQEALKAAEHASRAKSRFLAAASHDLRQPLHAFSFLAAALDMRCLDAPSREILQKMTDALEDLSVEFDALLDISKLDAGLVPIATSSFDAGQFLRRIAQPFVAVAQSRGILFEVAGQADVFVHTDRALLERIVRNLLDNAFKYTARGAVRLSCGTHGATCRIEIVDTGVGIPQAEQERVFEEFYQLGNPERDRRKGMGLGLSIVRRLATLLRVSLSMGSEVGRGTTFTLELPAAEAPQVVEVQAPASPAELRDRQVLLIDDEVSPRDALRGYLEALGCRVSVAGTVTEAAALAMLDEPDIVLADFRLRQGESGLDAIRRLRESRPDLPAIIVTGDTAPERLAEFDAAGIEVLHKPVVPARLVESMAAHIVARAASLPEEAL
jgi:signal transduction histidine kinase